MPFIKSVGVSVILLLALSLGVFYWRHISLSHSPLVTARILPQPQQVVKGWGCYPSTFQLDRPHADKFTIFNRPNATRLIFDLGFDIMRCNILPRSYDERKDDGSLDIPYLDASLVRHLRLGQKHGIKKYLLTVWSPPAIFKNPPVTKGRDPKTRKLALLRPDREDAYCRYVVRVLDFLTSQRSLPKPLAFSIQNEPGFDPLLWDGVPYPVAQWQQVFKKMRRALDVEGYRDVLLIGPEAGSYEQSVRFVDGPGASALHQDAAFRAAMGGFAYHGYTMFSRKQPYLQQLRTVATTAQDMGKDVWMTEWSIIAQKRTPLDHTLEVAQRLGREMTYIPSNYWFWWQGWYYQHPKSEVLITGSDDKHLHISKSYYFLRKLWHSVPSGSVVKRIVTNDPSIKGFDPYAVQAVAFEYRGQMTVLLVNTTSQQKHISLQGLSGQIATSLVTDTKRDMAENTKTSIQNGETRVELPSRSIVLVNTQ